MHVEPALARAGAKDSTGRTYRMENSPSATATTKVIYQIVIYFDFISTAYFGARRNTAPDETRR